MADNSYLVDDPGGYDALLTTCTSCMPNKASTCPDCSFEVSFGMLGEDPDGGSYSWSGDDASGQVGTRSGATDRWPYQIKTVVQTMSCDSSCVYLVRVQYNLETSSARRSFFQCGFSDIWLVERWNSSNVIQEMFCVATSLPFDINNAQFSDDYADVTSTRMSGSTGSAGYYFNPYGLREAYDQNLGDVEHHCGTVMFFARGNDKIKFRLAQHTNMHEDVDINPDEFEEGNGVDAWRKDYPSSFSVYNVVGNFYTKAYTRPIPGKLKLSEKDSGSNLGNVKYHPKLFS